MIPLHSDTHRNIFIKVMYVCRSTFISASVHNMLFFFIHKCRSVSKCSRSLFSLSGSNSFKQTDSVAPLWIISCCISVWKQTGKRGKHTKTSRYSGCVWGIETGCRKKVWVTQITAPQPTPSSVKIWSSSTIFLLTWLLSLFNHVWFCERMMTSSLSNTTSNHSVKFLTLLTLKRVSENNPEDDTEFVMRTCLHTAANYLRF